MKHALHIESLESKVVPAGNPIPEGITLNIYGTLYINCDDQDNVASVGVNQDGLVQVDLGHYINVPDGQGGFMKELFPDESKTFDATKVKRLYFIGDGGDDEFTNNTAFPSTALGGEGHDYLIGGSGNDNLVGGEGDDALEGRQGNDTTKGGAGNDAYAYQTPNAGGGSLGADSVIEVGGVDVDWLDFSNLTGGITINLNTTATQTVKSGALNLTLSSSTGIEDVWGTNGNDKITGNSRNNNISGFNGNDTITSASGNDFLYGGVGNDVLDGGSGNDTMSGDNGHDTMNGGTENDTITGGSGNDNLTGANGNDVIIGGIGHDTVSGGLGNDGIYGDGGFDKLAGNSGNDTMHGGTDDDELLGGSGNDTLNGDDGHDMLNGDTGNDVLNGDAGDDTLIGDNGGDVLSGGSGNDVLDGGLSNDTLNGDDGDDFLDGGIGKDTMDGGVRDNDTLFADQGNETLSEGEHVEIKVPGGNKQNNNWSCGPNSAWRLLQSYGINVSYNQLMLDAKQENLITNAGLGTPGPSLLNVLKKYKSNSSLKVDAEFQDILDRLGEGRPVLALLGWDTVPVPAPYGFDLIPSKLHYVCLTGFDLNDGVLFFTDTNGEAKQITFADFQAKWNWTATGLAYESLKGLGVYKQTILW